MHVTAADGTIDLTLRKRRGVTQLLLSGPTSRARPTAFEAGDEVLTIRLRTGVHLPFVNGVRLTDVDSLLPVSGSHRFWLHGSSVAFPTFATVETFAKHLAQEGLIGRDIVVEDVLSKRARGTNVRTVQRHFLAATGLTMHRVRQIRRAEEARSLLASGHTIASIAYDTGYSNPGHMTNAFKYFFGQSPSEMRALMRADYPQAS